MANRAEPAVVYPASGVGSVLPVPTWNLRHRSANQYKRQVLRCRQSYRRQAVRGRPWCHDGRSISKQAKGCVVRCRLVHGGPRGPFPVRGRGTRWASRVHECGGGSRVRVHAGRAKTVRRIFLFRRPDCPIADTPSQMKASWRNDAVQKRGESIQSFHRTCAKSRAGRCI